MKASTWEFSNRAMIFGLIFGASFPLYALDQQNCTVALAYWIGPKLVIDSDSLGRVLFVCAALLLVIAAFIRTWGSAYLHADVVYASDVKSHTLVAGGPYRHMRNPLYFGNLLLGTGMGAMMSRPGFVLANILMVLFCYRLIVREEAELGANQGTGYVDYCKQVPRIFPTLRPRVPAAGSPQWSEGLKAEGWFWSFPLAVAAFAISFSLIAFYVVLGISLVTFFVSTQLFFKKASS